MKETVLVLIRAIATMAYNKDEESTRDIQKPHHKDLKNKKFKKKILRVVWKEFWKQKLMFWPSFLVFYNWKGQQQSLVEMFH